MEQSTEALRESKEIKNQSFEKKEKVAEIDLRWMSTPGGRQHAVELSTLW